MGVYINMEMPTSCFDCPCYHHKIDVGYYDYEICRASGTIFNDGYSSVTGHKDHIDPFKARLENCPLVPVPPHGDLVDRAEMREIAISLLDKAVTDQEANGIREMWSRLGQMPVYIPADEGET